jgi:hypothetical protein
MHKPTAYQNNVNSLPGALGPTNGAFWNNSMTTTGPAYTLGAQPLYYSPVYGKYITSADTPAAQGSVSFGFGRRKSRKSRKRKSRKSRKRKSRKSRKRKSRKSRKTRKSRK